jgi:hypothetical protein
MKNQLAAIKDNISFEATLRSAVKLPGVRINRESFLRKELSKFYDDDIVEKAIITSPARAGLSVKNLERIAKSCIIYETAKVSVISAAAGIPGFKAMIATVPADMLQFFGHVFRILQKLAYLYGWPEMFKDGSEELEDVLDDETSNELTLFVGVMFGVSTANAALSKIAMIAAMNVPKKLMRQALTKTVLYKIVHQTAKIIGVRMTKTIFTQAVGKAIPIVGAVTSGGITFAAFKPMAVRLKKYLAGLPTASAEFCKEAHDGSEIIEVDFSDIDISDMEDEITDEES